MLGHPVKRDSTYSMIRDCPRNSVCVCVTWRQVLAVAGGVDQDVGVEGGIEPFISTVKAD